MLPKVVVLRKAEELLVTGSAVERGLGQASDVSRGERARASVSFIADGEAQRLFARVAPVVNRLVWSMLGPDSEREDIAHEAFIRIFRARESLRNVDVVEAWAARVTINTVRNELRRRRLRRWVPFDFWGDGPALGSHIEDVQGRAQLKAAFRVLDRLPTDERVVLSLRLFENIEIEEIARLTECSTRTTKRRLSSARERFELLARRDPQLRGWLDPQTQERDDG